MTLEAYFVSARKIFHKTLLENVLTIDKHGIATNADKDSRISRDLAYAIVQKIGQETSQERLAGQRAGNHFEEICASFLENTFTHLKHLRPGNWEIKRTGGRNRLEIANYEQYSHLIALDKAAKSDPELAAALGSDYTITPDITILRYPEDDNVINKTEILVDQNISLLASIRRKNNIMPLLHASISCKWTIRSDRAQNARSEALNLVRNRKGKLPHVVVVTAEPTPNRIASIALGTGDIDCVYHFALGELRDAVNEKGFEDAAALLDTMINGKRLRDIADLPLDLVV